jgi:aspartate aminotransferase-like enzyme/GNAT superfamily N-acetyltransferase
MNRLPELQFKLASESWEFEAIHRLNHKTFAEEIPQHPRSSDQRLVDRFHAENSYVICVARQSGRPPELAGMVSLRSRRPFSLDQKLQDLDRFLPKGRSICEFRLLAVEPAWRRGPVTLGLMRRLMQEAIARGHDYAIISGTTRQIRMYEALGFKPFGPLTGRGEAQFQPMGISREDFERSARLALLRDRTAARTVNLLPGPVAISREVREAFESPPVSHRSPRFLHMLRAAKRRLCELARARRVEVLLGSGTLANEAIALQIKRMREPGLVLSSGEFGERLLDQAARHGIEHAPARLEWGRRVGESELAALLARHPTARWVWGVHCETSTGVLNDLPGLVRACDRRGVRLCLDCISSIGVVPVDLSGVFLASSVSGKGLASYPGLALVFYHHRISQAEDELPRYLDLGFYADCGGTPFTQSSNLVQALHAAVETTDWERKFAELEDAAPWFRERVVEAGFRIVADAEQSSPGVFTIALPPGTGSLQVGRKLERAGFLLNHRSRYLAERNWIQVCLMNGVPRDELLRLVGLLRSFTSAARTARAWEKAAG